MYGCWHTATTSGLNRTLHDNQVTGIRHHWQPTARQSTCGELTTTQESNDYSTSFEVHTYNTAHAMGFMYSPQARVTGEAGADQILGFVRNLQ
jgi:hypothetical protein